MPEGIITVKISIPIPFTDPACRVRWAENATFEATGTKDEVDKIKAEFLKWIEKASAF